MKNIQDFKIIKITQCHGYKLIAHTPLMTSSNGNKSRRVNKKLKIKLKAPDRCAQLFDRERYVITDKLTNGRTDATKRIISLASRSIITP